MIANDDTLAPGTTTVATQGTQHRANLKPIAAVFVPLHVAECCPTAMGKAPIRTVTTWLFGY